MGQSKFCQWDEDDRTFGDAVGGACTSRCTEYCNNFFAPEYFFAANSLGYGNNYEEYYDQYYEGQDETWGEKPNACGKCYGMYPGRHPNSDGDPYKTVPDFDFHNLCP